MVLPVRLTAFVRVRAPPPAWRVALLKLSAPVPAAVFVPSTTVPAFTTSPPAKVFAPLRTSVPAPLFVNFRLPEDCVTMSPKVTVPAPLKVKVRAAVIVIVPLRARASALVKVVLAAMLMALATMRLPPAVWIFAPPNFTALVPNAESLPMASVPAVSEVAPE